MAKAVADSGPLSELVSIAPGVWYARRGKGKALGAVFLGFRSPPERNEVPISFLLSRPNLNVVVFSTLQGPFDMEQITEAWVAMISELADGDPVLGVGHSIGSVLGGVVLAKGHSRGKFPVIASAHFSGLHPDALGRRKAMELAVDAALRGLPDATLSELAAQLVPDAATAGHTYYETAQQRRWASVSLCARAIIDNCRVTNAGYRAIGGDAMHLGRFIGADLGNALAALSFLSGYDATRSLALLNRSGIPRLVMRGSPDWISPPSASDRHRRAGPYRDLVTASEIPGGGHYLFASDDERMLSLWELYGGHLDELLAIHRSGHDVNLREVASSVKRFQAEIGALELATAGERGRWDLLRGATGFAARITGGRGDTSPAPAPGFGLVPPPGG